MMLIAGMDAADGNSNLLGDDGVGGDGALEPDAVGIAGSGGAAGAGTPATGATAAVEKSLRQDAACSTTFESNVRSFRLDSTCEGSRISFNVGQLSGSHPRVASTWATRPYRSCSMVRRSLSKESPAAPDFPASLPSTNKLSLAST